MGYALRIVQTMSAQYQLQPRRDRQTGPSTSNPRLVQPGARKRLLPHPGADRLYRHDLIGRLHSVIGRAGKGAGHDGAGRRPRSARARTSSARRCRTLHLAGDLGSFMCSVDAVVRAADEGSWLMLILALSLYWRRARPRADDFDRRRVTAGRVSARGPGLFLPTMILSGFVFPIAACRHPSGPSVPRARATFIVAFDPFC